MSNYELSVHIETQDRPTPDVTAVITVSACQQLPDGTRVPLSAALDQEFIEGRPYTAQDVLAGVARVLAQLPQPPTPALVRPDPRELHAALTCLAEGGHLRPRTLGAQLVDAEGAVFGGVERAVFAALVAQGWAIPAAERPGTWVLGGAGEEEYVRRLADAQELREHPRY